MKSDPVRVIQALALCACTVFAAHLVSAEVNFLYSFFRSPTPAASADLAAWSVAAPVLPKLADLPPEALKADIDNRE